MQKFCRSSQTSLSPVKMKQSRPPFPLMFVIYCLCTAQFTSGFPQPFAGYLSDSDIPKNERLALCFSQWTEQSDQPQISSSIMDFCNSVFNSMQIDEENMQEIYKRFLFHYSRAQDPTNPLKAVSFPLHPLMHLAPKLSGRRMKRFLDPESQMDAEEFTKKGDLDGLGRPFFLFRVYGFSITSKKKKDVQPTVKSYVILPVDIKRMEMD